jgi:hypothetical protein
MRNIPQRSADNGLSFNPDRGPLVDPAPGLAAAEHAAKGAALDPQAVRAFQRDRGIIATAGFRVENPPAPFGVLAGFHIDQNLFAVLVRLCVHGISAEIGAASNLLANLILDHFTPDEENCDRDYFNASIVSRGFHSISGQFI